MSWTVFTNFTPVIQGLTLYRGVVQHCMYEGASATHYETGQSQSIRPIRSPPLTDFLLSRTPSQCFHLLLHSVSISMDCSSELTSCLPYRDPATLDLLLICTCILPVFLMQLMSAFIYSRHWWTWNKLSYSIFSSFLQLKYFYQTVISSYARN